jgi:hypothetical protein
MQRGLCSAVARGFEGEGRMRGGEGRETMGACGTSWGRWGWAATGGWGREGGVCIGAGHAGCWAWSGT